MADKDGARTWVKHRLQWVIPARETGLLGSAGCKPGLLGAHGSGAPQNHSTQIHTPA